MRLSKKEALIAGSATVALIQNLNTLNEIDLRICATITEGKCTAEWTRSVESVEGRMACLENNDLSYLAELSITLTVQKR